MRAGVRALGLLVCTLGCLIAACTQGPRERVLTGATMGTTWTVKVVSAEPAVVDEIEARIAGVLTQIDEQMSTYRADSVLARFNAHESRDWFEVPVELAQVIAAAQRLSVLTQGAFDVTVAPLVALWGFGPDGLRDTIPGEAELAAARASVGFGRLEVRLDPPALRKAQPTLEVDLNAIAPGYAVDRIAMELEAVGIVDYLVDVGGELRARGRNGAGLRWRVAVERPSEGPREAYTVIELDDRAIATSGDYRQYFEAEGRRYSHTLDPRTARPVEHALAAVAVVSESAMLADGLATVLAILGPTEGRAFVEAQHLVALFLVRDGAELVEWSTPAFERLRVDRRS